MTMTKINRAKLDEQLKESYNITGEHYNTRRYICKKCNVAIDNRHMLHYKRCVGLGTRRNQFEGELNITTHSKVCDLGCGNKSEFFYKSGKAYCSKFASKCPVKVKKDSESKKGINPFEGREHPRGAVGHIPWNKGETKETSEKVRLQGETFKKTYALIGNQRKILKHTQESKDKIRANMKARYASGWQSHTCGRAKSYPYSSPIAGDIHLTGTWEVAIAQILDKLNIQWQRNRIRFPYIKPDEKNATYLPDFYILEKGWETYFECKGYQTEIDNCKFTQFPNNESLIVIKRKEIEQIKKWLADPESNIAKEDLWDLIISGKI